MARVFTAFYNSLKDDNNPDIMPAFYEAFIVGLVEKGNQVLKVPHPAFGLEKYPELEKDDPLYEEIVKFNPDICILFNNAFYDLSDIVDCPIVVYEVDSPHFYSNKDVLKTKKDRFLHFIFQSSSRDYLKNAMGIEDKYIFEVPFFTEIYAKPQEIESNIAFVGSNWSFDGINLLRVLLNAELSDSDYTMLQRAISLLLENPNDDSMEIERCIDRIECIKEDPEITPYLVKTTLLNNLSGEKRLKILGVLTPLGLKMYGSKTWATNYYYDMPLSKCYDPKTVYSVADIQHIYNAAKIGISCSHIQAVSGFPWRVMDVMASSACLVSDYHSDFHRFFGDVADLIPTYENPGEAYMVCKNLLEDEEKRRYIVEACNEFVNNNYRFENCLRLMEQYAQVTMHS